MHLWLYRAMQYVTIKTVIKQIANFISCILPPSAPAAQSLQIALQSSRTVQPRSTAQKLNVFLTVLIKEIAVRTLWTQIRFE